MTNLSLTGKKESLLKIFGIANAINEECNIMFKKDKVTLRGLSIEKGNYFELDLNKDYFAKYGCEESFEISTDVSKIIRVLEMCSDNIDIEFHEEIKIISKKEFSIEAKLPFFYTQDITKIGTPSDSITSIKIGAEMFTEALKRLTDFSTYLEVGTNEGSLELKSVESLYGNLKFSLPVDTSNQSNSHKIQIGAKIMEEVTQNLEKDKEIIFIIVGKKYCELKYEEENLKLRVLTSAKK